MPSLHPWLVDRWEWLPVALLVLRRARTDLEAMTLRSLPPEFLRKGEMAEVLRVAPATFDRMRRRGLRMGCPCPENTWGTSILVFRCADVIRWAESLEDRSAA